MTFNLALPYPPDAQGNILVVEYATGNTVVRPFSPKTDMTWDELSGAGYRNPNTGTLQPFAGCNTGGDIVADRLMYHLSGGVVREGNPDYKWGRGGLE